MVAKLAVKGKDRQLRLQVKRLDRDYNLKVTQRSGYCNARRILQCLLCIGLGLLPTPKTQFLGNMHCTSPTQVNDSPYVMEGESEESTSIDFGMSELP
jgi:hypothetical protein